MPCNAAPTSQSLWDVLSETPGIHNLHWRLQPGTAGLLILPVVLRHLCFQNAFHHTKMHTGLLVLSVMDM